MGMFGFSKAAAKAPKPTKSARKSRSIRNYAGALVSRLNTGWGNTPTPSSYHIWKDLQTLRTRSREQYRNNDYAKRFITLCKANIVGHQGIVIQAQIKDLDGKLDKLANDAIEQSWRDWSRVCDAGGRLSLTEMCKLIVATVAIDGECLVRRVLDQKHGYTLKLIDPELLDIKYNDSLSNGNVIRMGIESDANGRAVAYYLLKQIATLSPSNYQRGKHLRVPAEEINHLFLSEMVDQERGVPWMASALERMKNLHGYEQAAVINARIGASKMGFFQTKDGGIEDLADDETLDGEFIQDAEPGAFEVIPEGWELNSFNPDYPHQQFGEFIKATLRGVASGLGVAYNGLANDLEGVNFSSIRSGVQDEREQWKTLQTWLIESFMRPLYEDWLRHHLSLGAITVPSKQGVAKALPAARFDKFKQAHFQGRRWQWVDPLKDMKANEAAVQLRLKSRGEIIREMGRDPDEVWQEIQREEEQLKAMGISVEQADAAMNTLQQGMAEVSSNGK